MDHPHGAAEAPARAPSAPTPSPHAVPGVPSAEPVPSHAENLPRDDDERFIVGLVLSYYRRHPQRARTRLLDLLGEVLSTMPAAPPVPAKDTAPVDDQSAWASAQRGIQPLKRRK
jgi:hypothetical protein